MNEVIEKKWNLLHKMAKLDPDYRKLQNRLLVLEDEFDEIVASLSDKEQDIVWSYVFANNEEKRRLTEIALQFVDFYKSRTP